MLGEREPFVHVPYFFYDVFDLSYEFWGHSEGAGEVVYRGNVIGRSFSAWWLQEGRVIAAFVINRPDEERELAPIRDGLGRGCMSPGQMKALVRREFAEVWNQGNLAAVDAIFAPDYVGHDSGSPEPVRGREALKRFFTEQRAALADLQARIEDLVAEGDRVVVRWTTSGTQQGELLGVPPTGKCVTLTGISILRVAGEQIAEEWTTWDALAVLRELGAAPN